MHKLSHWGMHLILKPEVIFLLIYYSKKANSWGFPTVKKLQNFCIISYSDNDIFFVYCYPEVYLKKWPEKNEKKNASMMS